MSKKQELIRPDEEEEYDDVEDEEEYPEEEEEEEDTTLANSDVTQKYKFAAAFANKALQKVMSMVVAGARINELCEAGDNVILEETKKVYNKNTTDGNKMDKGIAFPTCVSVNSIVCHFSPCQEEASNVPALTQGDVVRVDLGCQIDGHCAVVGDTVVVGATIENPAPTPAANVIVAAHTAMNVITKALRPGTKVYEITSLIASVAEDFGVNVVEGVLSHNMRRYIIDGNNVIAGKDAPEAKVHNIELQENQVWALNVVFSTGPGKLRSKEVRTQIYKRSLEGNYQLKLQASREVFNEIQAKHQTFPFAVRQIKQKKARIGIQECLRHDVVIPYPVLYEKEGEHVALVKSTVLILPAKIDPVTGIPFEHALYPTEKKLKDPKTLAWMERNLTIKKKKSKEAAEAKE